MLWEGTSTVEEHLRTSHKGRAASASCTLQNTPNLPAALWFCCALSEGELGKNCLQRGTGCTWTVRAQRSYQVCSSSKRAA